MSHCDEVMTLCVPIGLWSKCSARVKLTNLLCVASGTDSVHSWLAASDGRGQLFVWRVTDEMIELCSVLYFDQSNEGTGSQTGASCVSFRPGVESINPFPGWQGDIYRTVIRDMPRISTYPP